MSRIFFVMGAITLFISCQTSRKDHSATARNEIAAAEKAFEQMATDSGIAKAFAYFADSNAVVKRRNDSLVRGKDGILNFYEAPYFKTATVTWSPDFIEASPDGQLAYTYGHYNWVSTDSNGKKEEARGVFHTVWKKQKDGSWRYVWD